MCHVGMWQWVRYMGDKQGRESGMKIEADDDEESEERVRARWD